MTARRIARAAVASIGFMVATACSSQPVRVAPLSTQEAQETQRKAAESLGVPIEKELPKSGIALRFIPAGTFLMGSPTGERYRYKKEQQHKVTLTKPFYLGKYEVTQGQWKSVMGSNPSEFKEVGDNAPVESVSWDDCTNFMKRLAELEGMPEGSFKLPTEAEWEYACRAGTQSVFFYGDSFDSSMGNVDGRYPYGHGNKGARLGKTMPVGQFKPNAWGLYDMHGNVWEWCADGDDYKRHGEDVTDPYGPIGGLSCLYRGGSWHSPAADCRSASRESFLSYLRHGAHGFRLALSAAQ